MYVGIYFGSPGKADELTISSLLGNDFHLSMKYIFTLFIYKYNIRLKILNVLTFSSRYRIDFQCKKKEEEEKIAIDRCHRITAILIHTTQYSVLYQRSCSKNAQENQSQYQDHYGISVNQFVSP